MHSLLVCKIFGLNMCRVKCLTNLMSVGRMMRILVVNATLVIEVVLVIMCDSFSFITHSCRILPQYGQQSPITIAIAIVITKGNIGML